MGLRWSCTYWRRRATSVYRVGVHDASVVKTLFSQFREINSSGFQMSLKRLLCRLVQVLDQLVLLGRNSSAAQCDSSQYWLLVVSTSHP